MKKTPDILAIPIITSFSECADFAVTVRPYLWQLSSLAQSILVAIRKSPSEVNTLYTQTNPFVLGLFFSIFVGCVFWVVSEVNKNYSWVDRFWSILPLTYVIHFDIWARKNSIPSHRLDLALVCVIIWSARLTFNYWRRGGYTKGSEDYRWAIVKERIGPVAMFALNATFISFMQSILLLLFASPAYILLLSSRLQPQITLPDVIFASIMISLVVIEAVADQQQWNYQHAKHSYQKSAKHGPDNKYSQADLDRGFIVSGLWSWSRHPNFAAEQAVWLTFYHWAAFASASLFNWTGVGVLGLLAIFQGSTWLTEKITAKKYPQYRSYQQLVGKFIPGILGSTSISKGEKDL